MDMEREVREMDRKRAEEERCMDQDRGMWRWTERCGNGEKEK